MASFDGSLPFPATLVRSCLGQPLQPGQMGVLLARAGVGKTACLTHIALEALAQGQKVLHTCIDELPDKIKIWYEELYRNFKSAISDEALLNTIKEGMVASRFIMSYMHHTFTPAKLEENIRSLRDQVRFEPTVIILDGLDFERVSRKQLEAIQKTAENHGASVWFSCRIHRHIDIANDKGIPYPCHELDDLFEAIILLEPKAQAISMVILKHGDQYRPPRAALVLNPRTFFLAEAHEGLKAQCSS